MTSISFIIGFLLVITGIRENFAKDFSMEYSFFLGSQFNYWGSLFVSMGYIGLTMLCMNTNLFGILKKSLRAVGQMAFTNYLLQTLICTTIFYGHGFGMYGKLERKEQLLIVFIIWVLQLIVSPVWLKYFRYGPFEWLWRSLTYWKIQPLKVAAE